MNREFKGATCPECNQVVVLTRSSNPLEGPLLASHHGREGNVCTGGGIEFVPEEHEIKVIPVKADADAGR